MAYDIAVIPGCGIGIDVVDATLPVLKTISETNNFDITTTRYDWGERRYLDEGSAVPEGGIDELEGYDAILHGSTGHPDVPDTVGTQELVLPIRFRFDQYINLRPSYLFDGVESPLAGYQAGEIDIVFYRENTEGEYSGMGGTLRRNNDDEFAIESAAWTKKGSERIIRAAFEEATQEERDGKVTSITKSNSQTNGPVLWDNVAEEVSEEYPDITLERMFVDAAAHELTVRPEDFDVMVGSNLFSDILTDLTAGITGGLGLTPSANINPQTDAPGLFEPIHGSAPDIAGKGIANPLAEVLSASLMLDDLGESDAASQLWEAVTEQIADNEAPHTPDLGGDATTEDVYTDLQERLSR